MPRDVAVHEPRARVAHLEGDDQVPVQRQHGHVAAGRIVQVGAERVRVEGVVRLAEDDEVVAVQVDGMGGGGGGEVWGGRFVEGALDEEVDPLVVVVVEDDGRVGRGEFLVRIAAVQADEAEAGHFPVEVQAGVCEDPFLEA